MSYVQVAIGVIVESGRMLVCKRPAGGSFGGLWEFPGGKLLPDESPTECLHRELAEELGITIAVKARLESISHDYGDLKVTLHPFIATLESGAAEPHASEEIRWVTMDECRELEFPAANARLVAQLQAVLRSLGMM